MLCDWVVQDGREHNGVHGYLLASSVNGVSAGQEKLVLLVRTALAK